jgi:hypothetical protein
MATKVKRIDPASPRNHRVVTFSSASSDYVQDDVLDVYASLIGPSGRMEVDVAADAAVTFTVNGLRVQAPIAKDALKLGLPVYDLASAELVENPDARSYTLGSGESLYIDGIGVSNITVTALTSGAGTGVVFRFYSTSFAQE